MFTILLVLKLLKFVRNHDLASVILNIGNYLGPKQSGAKLNFRSSSRREKRAEPIPMQKKLC